ncbi:MAG: hypothetical protein AAF593_15310 [Planctomycetota bacterium]
MRIDPRASLSVQLIQEANFGPERFAPLGPPLSRAETGSLPFRHPADLVQLSPPVEPKPEPCPADTHICDGRLGPVAAYLAAQSQAEPAPRVEVREVVVHEPQPGRGVGSLIDVVA